MKNFFNMEFLFGINRLALETSDKIFLAIGLAAAALAAVFKLAEVYAPTPVDKKYRRRFFNVFLTTGLLELVWYAARWQNIRFFGTRFVAILILLSGLVWLAFVVKAAVKQYRNEKQQWEKEQVKQKYLVNK